MIRGVLLATIGLAAACLSAYGLFVFFEADSCLDAGGVFDDSALRCDILPTVRYTPVFFRSGLYVLWCFCIAVCVASGIFVAGVLRAIFSPRAE